MAENGESAGFKLNVTYKKSKNRKGFFGFIMEVPGVVSQGRTLEELKENLRDALLAMFESNRAESKNAKPIPESFDCPEEQAELIF